MFSAFHAGTAAASLTRTAPCAFRPPYGNYDSATLRLARQRRMDVWLWSADTQDWMAADSGARRPVTALASPRAAARPRPTGDHATGRHR